MFQVSSSDGQKRVQCLSRSPSANINMHIGREGTSSNYKFGVNDLRPVDTEVL